MSGIKVISKQTHETVASTAQNSASIKIELASVVVIQEKLENVAEIKKDGTDLIVIMKDGQSILLEDYFAKGLTQNALVFDDGQKELIWTQFTDPQNFVDGVVYENIDSVNALLDFHIPLPEATPLMYGLGVAGLLAGGIALLSKDSQDAVANNTLVAVANKSTPTTVVLVANDTPQDIQKEHSKNTQADTPADAQPDHQQAKDTVQTADTQSAEQAKTTAENSNSSTHDVATDSSNGNPDASLAAMGSNAENAIYHLLMASTVDHSHFNQGQTTTIDNHHNFDLNELFSKGTDSSADASLPEQIASTNSNKSDTSSSSTENTHLTDAYSVQNVSLFDLLSSSWVA